MIAKRYLALLTGVAMATSTIVAPNATAQNETDTTVETTAEVTTNDFEGTEFDIASAAAPFNHVGDAIAGVDTPFPAPGVPAGAKVSRTVYTADGTITDLEWNVRIVGDDLVVTPRENAEDGEYALIQVTEGLQHYGQARITAVAPASETSPRFTLTSGIEPGGSYTGPNSTVDENADISIVVTGANGESRPTDGWTTKLDNSFGENEIKITAPQTVRKGDVAVVTARENGSVVGTITLTVQSDGSEVGESLQFEVVGDVPPADTVTFDVNSEGVTSLRYYVEDADGTKKSEDDWQVSLEDGVLSITTPADAKEGDRLILTALNSHNEVLGTANVKVAYDGILMALTGDVLAGTTASWPTRINEDNLEYEIVVTGPNGEPKSNEGYVAEVRDNEFFLTVPENAGENDRVQVTISNGQRTIGTADLRVIKQAKIFEINGDILASESDHWDHFINHPDFDADELTLGYKVVNAAGEDISREGWAVELTEEGLFVTAPAHANENDRLIVSVRDNTNRVVGTANLRVIAKAEDLAYNITGDILPGIESYWDIDLPDHQPEFEVFDRNGNPKSTEGWIVTFEDGVLRVTAPENARAGDVVKIVSRDDSGKIVGKARLRVIADGGDGSSAPWWAALIPILGVAGVIALLTGGSSLSSGSSGASSDNNGGGDNQGGGGAGDNGGNTGGGAGTGEGNQGGPATGPVGGQDAKAAAQAQAANAPAYTGGAATQPAAAAQQQTQGALANTGVQNTLMALVVGLLAATAGVFLLMARRRNG